MRSKQKGTRKSTGMIQKMGSGPKEGRGFGRAVTLRPGGWPARSWAAAPGEALHLSVIPPSARSIQRKARVPSSILSEFVFQTLLAARTTEHKGIQSKETTDISTERRILNLPGRLAVSISTACGQERGSPGSPRIPLYTRKTGGK